VSFLQRLEKRWDRREEGVEDLMIQASLSVNATPRRVWDFLTAPEASLLTTDGVRMAFRVPGTPVGEAGEQLCIVHEHAGTVLADILEVVTVDAPNCLVTRWITGVNQVVERTTLETESQGATSITVQIGMRVPRGTAKRTRPIVQADAEQTLWRIRSALESGARLPSELSNPRRSDTGSHGGPASGSTGQP
jgi:uncharacterized protein YndB with AHSA1/START domain